MKLITKWSYAATVNFEINLTDLRGHSLTADLPLSTVSQLLGTMAVTSQPLTYKGHLSGRLGAGRRSGSNGRVREVIGDAVCSSGRHERWDREEDCPCRKGSGCGLRKMERYISK